MCQKFVRKDQTLDFNEPVTNSRNRPQLKPTVGLIGIGEMGKPIAANLLKAGFSLVAYDLRSEPVEEVSRLGAAIASSPQDLARKASIIISILPSADAVTSSLAGVLGVASEGQTIIEMSTIDVQTTLWLEQQAAQKLVKFIDAPIAGSPDRLPTKDVIIIAGGQEQVVDACMPILQAIGRTVEYVGRTGNGKIAKLTNNLLIAIHKIATTEAICFALKQGIEPEVLFRIVRESGSDSKVFELCCESVIGNGKEIAERHSWHQKDLGLIMDMSKETQTPLPLGSLSRDIIQSAAGSSSGFENFQSLVDYYRKKMGLDLAHENRPCPSKTTELQPS